MRVLSFDVGVKNLSYADVSYDDAKSFYIHEWGIIDLTNGIDKDVHCLVEELVHVVQAKWTGARESIDMYSNILIENQPCMKNPTMKTIQIALYTCFKYVQAPNVLFVNARNKGKMSEFISPQERVTIEQYVTRALEQSKAKEASKSYQSRKLTSKAIVYTMGRLSMSEAARTTYASAKKQDDLADAACQAMHYLATRYK